MPCSSRAAGSAVMVPAAVAMVAAALCFAPSPGDITSSGLAPITSRCYSRLDIYKNLFFLSDLKGL